VLIGAFKISMVHEIHVPLEIVQLPLDQLDTLFAVSLAMPSVAFVMAVIPDGVQAATLTLEPAKPATHELLSTTFSGDRALKVTVVLVLAFVVEFAPKAVRQLLKVTAVPG